MWDIDKYLGEGEKSREKEYEMSGGFETWDRVTQEGLTE